MLWIHWQALSTPFPWTSVVFAWGMWKWPLLLFFILNSAFWSLLIPSYLQLWSNLKCNFVTLIFWAGCVGALRKWITFLNLFCIRIVNVTQNCGIYTSIGTMELIVKMILNINLPSVGVSLSDYDTVDKMKVKAHNESWEVIRTSTL